MKPKSRDYTSLTAIAKHCGLVPYVDIHGNPKEGVYTLANHVAPIDLTACAEDEKAILKTAVRQLSERLDEIHNNCIESNFR